MNETRDDILQLRAYVEASDEAVAQVVSSRIAHLLSQHGELALPVTLKQYWKKDTGKYC